ncbi:MAG TPA: hypothetical protein VGY56_03640 [Verrucomicrobiae bacterium]|nr:hypothetical protein [Verrucomicrobiae bacterium]
MGNGNHKPGQTQLAQSQNRGTLTQTQSHPPVTTGSSTGATTSPIGPRVLQYAQQRIGQKVGDGECFALADEALRNAGAASAADFGRVTPTADYKWSSQQVGPADARPGDVIQFRNSHITVKTEHADGSWEENTEERPHHTAVVVSNNGSGNLTVLEQNVTIGGTPGQAQKSVRQNQISATAGTRTVGTNKVTVTITGTMVVYRPVAHP